MKNLIFGTILLALITAASMPAISQAQQLNSMGIPIEDPSKPSPKPQVQQTLKPQAQQPQIKPQNPPAQAQKPQVQAQKTPVQQPPKPQVQPQKAQVKPQLNSLGIPVENPTKP